MLSNKLADTRLQVVSGSVITEVGELLQDNAITLKFQDSEISLGKRGLYRIDSDPAQLRVYDGEARVTSGDSEAVVVRKGHELEFGAKLEARSFDTKQTDAFYNWCARRDQYIAEANIYAAKSARDSGYGFTNTAYSSAPGYNSGYGFNTLGSGYGGGLGYGLGYGNGLGTWAFNPYFGMFTYMPYSGMFYSPFGYSFFSPGMVGYLYMPGSPYYGGSSGVGSGLVARNGSGFVGSATGSGATPVRAGFNAGSGSSGSGSSSTGGSTSRSSGVFGGVGTSAGHSSAGHK